MRAKWHSIEIARVNRVVVSLQVERQRSPDGDAICVSRGTLDVDSGGMASLGWQTAPARG